MLIVKGVSRSESLERGSRSQPDAEEVWDAARGYVWQLTDAPSAERWAEDVASETAREWWEKTQRGDVIRNWRGWVKTAVYHRIIKERRRDSRTAELTEHTIANVGPTSAESEFTEGLEGREAVNALREAMDAVKSRRQLEILKLSFFHGEDSTQIGRKLGMSPDAVRMSKARALDRLRKAHVAAGIKEPLLGFEIGAAAVWALKQRETEKGPLSGIVNHLGELISNAADAFKQLAGRLTGGGGAPVESATAGVGAGSVSAAGGVAAVGGGKLVAGLCAGAATVCAAGVMTGGIAITKDVERPAKPAESPANVVAAPVASTTDPVTPAPIPTAAQPESSPKASSQPKAEKQQRLRAARRGRAARRAASVPTEASASDAKDAFSPPVVEPSPAPSSPAGGEAQPSSAGGSTTSATERRSPSAGSGGNATGGEVRSAFGPGF